MPSNVNESTAKISMDITELKAGITEANRLIRLANSEFKAAASGMESWEDAADGLSQTIQALTKVQDAQQKKLELLQQEYKLVAAEQGESSREAQNLQIRINNQQTAINKTAAELKKYQKELDDVNSTAGETAGAVEDQRSSYEKLQDTISEQEDVLRGLKKEYASVVLEQGKNSKEAKDLAKEIKTLSGELSDNVGEMKSAESAADKYDKSLEDLGESAGNTEGGFTILKGAIAEFAGNVLTSAVSGIKDFIGSLFDLSEATEEYRSMMAKTSGSADAFGYSIEFATGKYEEFYRYLGDDQMSANAITNLMGMRVSTDTVSDAANAAIAVWSAYGDSIPIESLTESINESAQVAQVTGTLADAINWAARSNEDWSAAMAGHSAAQQAFNTAVADGESAEDAYSAALAACSDTQERADLIAQTLNQTYGDSKTKYDEMSGSILDANDAELELKETQAQLGQAMEPVNTAITSLKNDALQALAPLIEGVAEKFTGFLTWLKETPGAASFAAAAIVTLAAAVGGLAIAAGISVVVNGLSTAIKGLTAAMAGNPIGLIIVAITSLIAGLITLWTTNEGFRDGVISAWNAVVSFLSSAVSAIGNFFTVTLPGAIQSLINWFAQLPTNISNFVSQVWNSITTWASNMIAKAQELGSQFLQNVVNFFRQLPERIGYFIGYALGSIVKWVSNMIDKSIEVGTKFLQNVVNFFKNLPTNIANFVSSAYQKVTTWVSNMISKAIEVGTQFVNNVINFIRNLPSNLWNLLTSALNNVIKWGSQMISKAREAAADMAEAVINAIKNLPDTVMSIGSDIVHGIWNGISGAAGWLWDQVSGFASGIVDGFKDALGIASPSKVFKAEAKWIPAGTGEGITDNEDLALKPIQKLTKKMRSAAAGLSEALVPPEVTASLSGSIRRMRQQVNGAAQTARETIRETKNIVFNQYNNSPKALSRLDIYRQTKSQLFSAKGRLQHV